MKTEAAHAKKHPSTVEVAAAAAVAAVNPDTAQKAYLKILEQEINEGIRELQRPTWGLLISGLSAGLDVSFSVLVMAVILTTTHGAPDLLNAVFLAAAYAVGYIFVVMGRSELFTEHTTRSVYPVLHGSASLWSLLRLWGLIYGSNLAGCAIFAKLISIIGPGLGVIEPWSLGQLARTLTAHDGWVIFVSAILAGWLMGLLSWLVTAGRDTISQIVLVALITGAIGICHLHHSIVGTTEVLAAIFAHQSVTLRQFGHFLLYATLGNGIGGIVFVALIKYGHVMIGTKSPDHVNLEKASSK